MRNALTLAHLLQAGDGNGLAIADVNGNGLSYDELRNQIRDTHDFLARYGLAAGDTVAYALRNGPETAALFAALASYCRAAPLNPNHTASELALTLADLQPRMIITAPGAVHAADAIRQIGAPLVLMESDVREKPGTYRLHTQTAPHEKTRQCKPTPDDIALLLHTSGTTARPKLVPLTHRNLCLSSSAVRETLRLGPGDRCLSFMPFFHIHGLVAGLLASIGAGATVCCARGFHATSFYSWLESSQATWYTAVPTMHQAILLRASSNPEVLSRHRLRVIRSSSSPLFPSVWEQMEATFGVPVVNAYGMTEAAHQIACVPIDGGKVFRGSVGRSTGPEIGILDGSGSLLGTGEVGEVALRGAQVTNGYLFPNEANDQAYVNGWFRTGDHGFLDANGALILCGRIKEVINSGGEKVSPYEVEEALLNHPAVVHAAAFATPHNLLGEQVVAAVVIREDCHATENELLETVARTLARYKLPRRIFIVDEIPGGATGKIQRSKLTAFFGLDPSEPVPGEPACKRVRATSNWP